MSQALTRSCADSRGNNKARRHEVKMLKYRRRLRKYGLNEKEGNFYAFRSHGAPCSCSMCSHVKYKRAKLKDLEYKVKTTDEVLSSRCKAYKFAV